MVEQSCNQKLSTLMSEISVKEGSFGVLFGRIDGGQIDANGISRVLFGALDQRGNPLVREYRVFLTYESIEEALNSCGESPSQGFKKVWNFLQAKIERVSEAFPETERPRLIFYKMENYLPVHKDYFIVDDFPRTEAEKQFYKTQILSEPDSSGNYNMIPLEQAIDWCSYRAINYFKFMEFIEDKEDLTQEALIRALPYLEGERGSFTDFPTFQRAFNVIIKNLRNDMYRLKKILNEKSLDEREEWDEGFLVDDRQAKENIGSTISEESKKAIAERLGGLSLKDREVLNFRLQKVPYAKMAEIYGENANALRVRYYRILNGLYPQREKKDVLQWKRKPDAEMLSSYREFRNSFLTEKGRLPGTADINRAYKNGLIICGSQTYTLRFAGCYSWEAARGILEQEISREQEAEVI